MARCEYREYTQERVEKRRGVFLWHNRIRRCTAKASITLRQDPSMWPAHLVDPALVKHYCADHGAEIGGWIAA